MDISRGSRVEMTAASVASLPVPAWWGGYQPSSGVALEHAFIEATVSLAGHTGASPWPQRWRTPPKAMMIGIVGVVEFEASLNLRCLEF